VTAHANTAPDGCPDPGRPAGGPLVAVRSPREVDAGGALRWWTGAGTPSRDGPGANAVGFALCPRAAFWWRWEDDAPRDRRGNSLEGARDLGTAFEMVAFDGVRELRWLHSQDGRGRAVALAESRGALPRDGSPVDFRHGDRGRDGRPRRVGEPYRRILAGSPSDVGRGWTRLRSARYAPADLPVPLRGTRTGQDPVAVLAGVEYAVEDRHGNLTVVDSRLTGLEILERREVEYDCRTGAGRRPAGERP